MCRRSNQIQIAGAGGGDGLSGDEGMQNAIIHGYRPAMSQVSRIKTYCGAGVEVIAEIAAA